MLIAMIILSVVLMFVLPVVITVILTGRYHATWRTIGVGILAYLVPQVVMTFILGGLQSLTQDQLSSVIAGLPLSTILLYALVLVACILTVIAVWIGFRYLKEEADSWIGALALGAGVGGAQFLFIGIKQIFDYYPYVGAALFGVQSLGLSSSDATSLSNSMSLFLSTPWYYPLSAILALLTYMAVYLAMSIVVWQGLKKQKWTWLWLVGGMVWLIVVQSLDSVLTAAFPSSYWPEMFLFVALLISLEFLYWYKVNVLDKLTLEESTPEISSSMDTETVEPAYKPKSRKAKKNK